jgi:hypothetical protein
LSGNRRYGADAFFSRKEAVPPMLRIALIDVLLFALPFLVYAGYMVSVKGLAPAELWQGAPIFWLLAAGCGLLLVTMATLIQFSGGEPGGVYHPPTFEGGVIKPGEID